MCASQKLQRLKDAFCNALDMKRHMNKKSFFMACSTSDIGSLTYVLDKYPDAVTWRLPPHSTTGLHEAAFNGHAQAVQFLLERGADVNDADTVNHTTPLHEAMRAARNTPAQVVDVLFEFGAKAELQDIYGQTPMFYAAADGDMPLILKLMCQGIDVGTTDQDGKTAADIALAAGYTHCADFITREGVHAHEILKKKIIERDLANIASEEPLVVSKPLILKPRRQA